MTFIARNFSYPLLGRTPDKGKAHFIKLLSITLGIFYNGCYSLYSRGKVKRGALGAMRAMMIKMVEKAKVKRKAKNKNCFKTF